MHTQPQMVLIDESVERTLLEAAVAAPSIHNSQPWRFVVGPRRIEVYADPARQMRIADSKGRSLLISCGAALSNMPVAVEHLGFPPRVRLLPSDNPILVATLDVDHRHTRPGLLEKLYPAVWQRRTNRYPFWNRTPSPSILARLGEAVTQENASLRFYDDPDEVQRIVDLLHHAEFEEGRIPEAAAERAAWVTSDARDDGIPVDSRGPMPAQPDAAFRDLGNGRELPRPTAPFEATPTVAVLSTMHDRPLDWVRAGQALERLLLVATNEGLVASFMNQPLEQDELRPQVRSPLTGHGHPQMLMRLGYDIPVPPTADRGCNPSPGDRRIKLRDRIVVTILRRRPHGRLSRAVVVLRVRGRRTSDWHELPVQYAADGRDLVVFPGHPEHKRWWRNLRDGAPVRVMTDGSWHEGTGRVVWADDREYECALLAYCRRFPREAVPLDAPLVLIDLEGSP